MDHNKFKYIQNQIQEANSALQNWNDRRAEAMIELDSIFVEIEGLETRTREEAEIAQNTIIGLRANLAKSEKAFHTHFEAYTNEMQELKLTNENLTAELKGANLEVENQKQAFKKMEIEYRTQIEKMESEAEIRMAERQIKLKNQVSELVNQIQSIVAEKNSFAMKAEIYERELQDIRTQMMSALRTSNTATAEAAVITPQTNTFAGATAGTMVATSDTAAANISATVSKPSSSKLQPANMIVDNMGNPPTTVNDYLKRFGY